MSRFHDLNELLIEQPRCKTTGCQHNRNRRGFTPQVPTCDDSSSSELTAAPLLLRLDGDNDAIENIAVVEAYNEHDEQAAPVHYVTTWNPGQQSPEHRLAYAEAHGHWSAPRAGKRVALFAVRETRTHDGDDQLPRRVMRVIVRTIDKRGQQLLVPEIGLEGWCTSLEFDAETIIALYADHATSEPYHSEFKTDLDLECLPSGTLCHQPPDPRLRPARLQHPALDRAERTARRGRPPVTVPGVVASAP